ncbi:class I SAM-dependent methyltransferase [Candidatus Woesearchaeota archaeon]|nr:class I SAM-dependent methyltransferase [Candidatus Woesearchaeota archaeon]
MKSFLKLLDEKIFFPLRFNSLTKILIPYLRGSKTVLDIGASCGRLAKNIQHKLDIKFVGVDTHIQPKTFIPIKKYDGKKLPFKDNSFDCVMIIDVLHHDKNPQKIIEEAKRVSKKHILIKDNYWDNRIDFLLLKYADYIGNKPYGVNLPYKFLNIKSWQELIKNNNIAIVKSKKFRYHILDPCKHIIFKLKK